MTSNTIKIPHIAPHRPGVGGGSGFQLISALIITLTKFVIFQAFHRASGRVREKMENSAENFAK